MDHNTNSAAGGSVRTALIMEGGAMRGLFTCGVIDVFLENDITFDGSAGISAGATFGCNFKSGQAGRPLRYNLKYSKDKRYCSIHSLVTSGDLYNELFCYHTLPQTLDPFDARAFRDNPMEFHVGATDAETGEIVFHKCTDGGGVDTRWMQASASMPMVSRPVKIAGRAYLDGGIVCPVPYKYMEEKGFLRNVIILTQPAGFVKPKTSGMAAFRAALRKYPAVVKALGIRHEVYNRQMRGIAEREAAGTALVIRPPEPLGIRRTESDPNELRRVYQTGRLEAERRLAEIREFLY